MELYLLRHAIAVDKNLGAYKSDRDRPLTSEGTQKMLRVAKGMKSLDLFFDLILSSPFVRTRQTAEIVAKVFKIKKKLKFSPHLAVGGDPEELMEELKRDYDSLKSVLLVGHEPSLSHLISFLLTGDSSLSLEMKKAGLCKLNINTLRYGRCATLEWFLTPNQLTRLRRSDK